MTSMKSCDFQNDSAHKKNLHKHDRCHVLNSPRSSKEGLVIQTASAFTTRIITLSYENANEECILPEALLKEAFKPLQCEVNAFLKVHCALKFNIEFHTNYTHPNLQDFGNTLLEVKIFKTEMQEIYNIKDFAKVFLNHVKNIIRRTEEFQSRESGWTLLQLLKVDFNLVKYQPLKGLGYMQLPRKVERKQACINVKNKDEFCFKWALISAVADMGKHAARVSSYKVNIHSEIIKMSSYILNFKSLCFPLNVRDVSIFEENNPSISISVFGYDKETDLVIGPYYKTKKKKSKHINLLFFEDNINKTTVGHYVWIKNFSRLVRAQITANKGKIFVCDVCLKFFRFESELEKHTESGCDKEEDVLEEDKSVLHFKNYVKTIDVPFVIYANSECVFQNTGNYNPMPRTFSYFIKCSYNNTLNKFRCFKESNSQRLFVESLIKDAKYLYNNYSTKIEQKIPLTEQENLEFQGNNSCCICSKVIPDGNKVKLHCRLSGKYAGPAHHSCAFSYRIPKKFPVIFHNLSINDCRSFIKELNDIDDDPINVIPLKNESYVSFSKDLNLGDQRGKIELRFLNFVRFMPFSLDIIAQNLSKLDFKTLKSVYPYDENKLSLLVRKTVFPHNFLHFANKLTETCLPCKDHFYNKLVDEECSQEDYAHAKNVWSEFECKTLDDYLTLCLKTNVLILTDIFENFRLVCKNAYNLDPCHYYEASEYSWDAMLKLTDIKLKLLTDKTMISFLRKGMRGGISHCFQGHFVANNKYLSDYNDKLPLQYIIYFHANDLYGRVMSELLPEGNFEWETDIGNFSLDSIPYDSKIGYILEVDLQYPKEVHETHKNLPFCIENITSPGTTKKKLSLDLNQKNKYIIYYTNLQQCLKHGLKLQKIHRILKFNQTDWLKKHVLLNNNHSANAKSCFEMNVFNLMNNAIYEKIMESVGKKIKILKKWESEGRKLGARAFIVKPEFSSVSIFNEDLVAVELNTNPYHHTPIYLEFLISELAKYKMYSFHYDYIMQKYKSHVQLHYIDSDSFIYSIATHDFYKDIANDICVMFSTPACDISNNNRFLLKTLGIMKDAMHGAVIKEFIGLRPKMYSLKTDEMKKTYEANILENNVCNCMNCGNDLLKLKLHKHYARLVS